MLRVFDFKSRVKKAYLGKDREERDHMLQKLPWP